MHEERRSKIEAALHQYRETVSQHNFFLLRILVECIEAQPIPPRCSSATAQKLQIRQLRQRLLPVPEHVNLLRDLLNDDVRTNLFNRGSLDGVSHRPVNLKQREEYFAGVRRCIAEKNVKVEEFPPADLEYLCTLVSGITGPGLLNSYREAQQLDFISSIEDHTLKDMVQCVTVPIRCNEGGDFNELTGIWDEWEISVAFKIGGCPRGGSYALYCRNENNVQWKWRYGCCDDDWRSEVYNSVEEFLSIYAHLREQTEEDIKKSIRNWRGIPGLRAI